MIELTFALNDILSMLLLVYMTLYLIFNSFNEQTKGDIVVKGCRVDTPALYWWIVVETIFSYS